MTDDKQRALMLLREKPFLLAHKIGFDKLTELHNKWIIEMTYGQKNKTLQAHRASYKTTCVSVALVLIMILYPDDRVLFVRKTDANAREIMTQVQNILRTPFIRELVRIIWGVELSLVKATVNETSTNLLSDVKGTAQLTAIGIGGSLTGKHYDRIFTDDIVTLEDRVSRAERDRTKLIYQELQNVLNRDAGCRMFNTGTPWHKDDCFMLMPEPMKYDCYSTGIMSKEDIEEKRASMLPSLFSANYELKHIAGEDVIFTEPQRGADKATIINGLAHVDSAFYGDDYTALTIMSKHDGKYYVYGKIWRKHVEDCYSDIKAYYDKYLCSKLYNETNADKGMVAKDMRKQGMKVVTYHEKLNKHIKIVTYLKAIWQDVIFIEGTDESYINQICDYTEDAEHDDAPDSCACLARLLYKKQSDANYKSLF